MNRGARIGTFNAPLAQMNLQKAKTTGYVRGTVGKALTKDERKNGGVGFTAEEWKDLPKKVTHRNGKMTRGLAGTPLRKNHKGIAGECCDTSVDGDDLVIHAMVDLTTAEGLQAWQDIEEGRVTMFSVGFVARASADWDNGNREYENEFREVSLTEKGVVESAYINVAFSQMSENSGQTQEFELKDIATGESVLNTVVEPSTASPIEEDPPVVVAAAAAAEPTPTPPTMSSAPNDSATPMETAPPLASSSPAPAEPAHTELTPEQIAAFSNLDAAAIANLAMTANQSKAEAAELRAQMERAMPFLQRAQEKEQARETRKRMAEEKERADKITTLTQLAKETQFGANLDDPADREIVETLLNSGAAGTRALSWLEHLAQKAKAQNQELQASAARLSVYEPPKSRAATRRAVESPAAAAAPAAPANTSKSLLDNLKGLNKQTGQPKPAVPSVPVAQPDSTERQDMSVNPYHAAQLTLQEQIHQQRMQMEQREAMTRAPEILDAEAIALGILSRETANAAEKCAAAYTARHMSEKFPLTVTCSANGMTDDDMYHRVVADAREDTRFTTVRHMGALGSKFDQMFFYGLHSDAMAALSSANNPLNKCSVPLEKTRGYNPAQGLGQRPSEIVVYPSAILGTEEWPY